MIDLLNEETLVNIRIRHQYWVFATALAILSLLSACSGIIDKGTSSPHKLWTSVEGRYTVSYVFNPVDYPYKQDVIGHLSLKAGEYIYTPVEDINLSDDLIERLIFITEPKGNYIVDYPSVYDQNTILENLEDSDALILIRLSDEKATREEIFYLNIHFENRELVFSSFFVEVKLWRIYKSWDD